MKTILVVDDSPTMRCMAKVAFDGLSDIVVQEANDGLEALKILKQQPVDLIVLDLHMPGMDGLDVVRHVRAVEPLQKIPIIMLSGGSDESSREASLAIGASCCIAKPFDPDELRTQAYDLMKVKDEVDSDATSITEPSSPFHKFMDDYFAECEEHLANLHHEVPALEKYLGQPNVDPDLLNAVFRRFHSINGMSSMVKVDEAEHLAETMETYLLALQRGEQPLSAVGILALKRGVEMLDRVIAARRAGSQPPECSDVLAELDQLILNPQTDITVPAEGSTDSATHTETSAPVHGEGTNLWQVLFTSSPDLAERGITVSVIQQRLKELGKLIHIAPLMTESGQITFEFLLDGNVETEAALAGWVEDGLTYTKQESQEPVEADTSAEPAQEPVDATEMESVDVPHGVVQTVDVARETEQPHGEPSKSTNSFLLFSIDERQYAIDVAAVDRAVPAAEVTPMPHAPGGILGLLDIAGEVMPVVDMRRRLGFQARDMELSDRFIVTRVSGKPQALLVDKVDGVVELPQHAVSNAADACSGFTIAVATMPKSIVLIQDINAIAAATELPVSETLQQATHA